MPVLVIVTDGTQAIGGDGVEEFLGDVRLELGVVVAQAGHEGPLVPTDRILREQGIGVDSRVREVAGLFQHIRRADRADGGAAATHRQASAAAAARTGDLFLLDAGAISQQVVGFSDDEGLVQLRVEHPLLFFVQRVPRAHDVAGEREVVFQGARFGLGDLVVEAPLDVVGQQRVEDKAMLQAETFTADGVLGGARAVHAHRLAAIERAADRAFLIAVVVVLVLLVGQAQARVVGVVPAGLGQHVGGAHVFRVGGGAIQASAVVVIVGFGLVAVALAEVQQAVELLDATRHGGGFQPAVIGRAVAGFQAGTDVLAGLDDVVRVEGEIAHRAANGAAAIKGRRRATENFHALDDFRVDVVALGLGVWAVEETVGDFHAVDLGQDPVAVDTTNVVAADAAAGAGAADRNARFIAHQVLDAVDVVAVELFAGLHADRGRHAVDALFLARGADGHLLQGEGAAGGAFFQDDVVRAQFAIAQVGPHQQAIQGFFRAQCAVHARRGDAFAEFSRQADLPASDGGEGIEGRHQRLLGNRKTVVAHVAARLLGCSCGQHRRGLHASHQDGGSQQGQRAVVHARR